MLLSATALVALVAWRLPPIPDEAYYWTWSRALAFHYLDHPPLIAWAIALETGALGTSAPSLRAISLLCLVGSFLLSVDAARRRGGDEAAVIAGLLLLASPMFLIGLIPMTPDPLHALATALAAWLTVRAFDDRRPAWPLLLALVLTLSVQVKHYAAFIAFGALLGASLTVEGRKHLRAPAPWIGLLAGMVAASPWIFAELSSGEASSASFQLTRVLSARPRGIAAVPLVLGSMLGTLGLYAAPAIILEAFSPKLPRRTPVDLVLGMGATALLLACFLAAFLGSGEANWPLPALLFALPAVAARAAEHPRALVCARWVGGVGTLCTFTLLAHASFPFLPIDRSKDPTARGERFDRIAAVAQREADVAGAKAIVTRRYQFASLLRMHVDDRVPVLELGTPGGRKSQFDLWPKPVVCAGDVAVVAMASSSLPAELAGELVRPPTRLERPGIDVWSISVVRLTKDLSSGCPAASTSPETPVSRAKTGETPRG